MLKRRVPPWFIAVIQGLVMAVIVILWPKIDAKYINAFWPVSEKVAEWRAYIGVAILIIGSYCLVEWLQIEKPNEDSDKK